jgi:hypothetical protein
VFFGNVLTVTGFGEESKWLAAWAGRVFLVFANHSRYAHAKSHPPMMKKGA